MKNILIEHINDLDSDLVESFSLLASSDGVKFTALVTLTTDGNFPNFPMHYKDSKKFMTILSVKRKQVSSNVIFPYHVAICAYNAQQIFFDFQQVENVEYDLEKLEVSFYLGRREVFAKFSEEYGYRSLMNFVNMFYLALGSPLIFKFGYGKRRLAKFEDEDSPKRPRSGSLFQLSSHDYSGLGIRKKPWYKRTIIEWTFKEIEEWLKLILFQETDGMSFSVTNLHKKLTEMDALQNLSDAFHDSDWEGGFLYQLYQEIRMRRECETKNVTKVHLLSFFDKFGEDCDEHPVLERLYTHVQYVCQFWRDEKRINIHFYKVFQKYVKNIMKKMKKMNKKKRKKKENNEQGGGGGITIRGRKLDLVELEEEVFFQKRNLWDLEYLLNEIILGIVYGSDLKSFEEHWSKKLMENKFIHELSEREEVVRFGYPATKFITTLREWNNEIGSRLENLHFDIYFKKRVNRQYRIGIFLPLHNELMKNKEETKRVSKLVRMLNIRIKLLEKDDDQKKKIEKALEMFRTQLKKNRDRKQELRSRKIEIEKEMARKKLELYQFERSYRQHKSVFFRTNFKNHIKCVRQIIDLQYRKRMKKEFPKIDTLVVIPPKKREEFNFDEDDQQGDIDNDDEDDCSSLLGKNRLPIEDVITNEIDMKLVISRNIHDTPFMTKKKHFFARKASQMFDPRFFRFGVYHAYIMLKGVEIHFFSNSLCFVSEMNDPKYTSKYRPVTCLDLGSPIITNLGNLHDIIRTVAKEIVYWNAFMKYSKFGIRKGGRKYNCQEFSLNLMKVCNVAPVHKHVMQYIQEIRNVFNYQEEVEEVEEEEEEEEGEEEEEEEEKMMKKKKKKKPSPVSPSSKKLKSIRFIMVEPLFWKMYSEKARELGCGLDGLEKRIFFPSHMVLDEFVHMCKEEDPDFEMNNVGVYQLLKGFDRAYWMIYDMRLKDENSLKEEEEIGSSMKKKRSLKNSVQECRERPSANGCPFNKTRKREEI